MLVLSRKPGEEIVIDGNIRVRVVAVRGNQVRLGFTAPVQIPIRRQELEALPEDELPLVGKSGKRNGRP